MPFALAAGALGVPRKRFLVVYGAARSVRYVFVAWLGVTYGHEIVRFWSRTLQAWSTTLLCVFGGLMIVSAGYAVWKLRELRKTDPAKRHPLPIESVRSI